MDWIQKYLARAGPPQALNHEDIGILNKKIPDQQATSDNQI
jgi:hypothetical protein